MEIDDGDVLRPLQEAVGDGMQGAVGPGWATAAEEHAVGMAVLAARHGAEKGDVAYLLAIGRELGVGGRDPVLAEIGGTRTSAISR